LDVCLFGLSQSFYGLAVDNHIRSGQSIVGNKKSITIRLLTKARKATFTSHKICQSFSATGINSLNPRRVLSKLNLQVEKRKDTLGIIKKPTRSCEIRHQVLASAKLLATLTLTNADSTVNHVNGIMSSLGHQLE